MIQKWLVTVIFLVQNVANAVPLMKLKDYTVNSLSPTTVEVVYKSEKIVFEKKSDTQFKLNGQLFSISSEDTFEQVEAKMQKAYKASQKRSASVEDLLFPKANAITPLFAAAIAAVFGFVLCDATKKNQKNDDETPEPVTVQ